MNKISKFYIKISCYDLVFFLNVGIIEIDNPAILNMAIDILKEYHSDVE